MVSEFLTVGPSRQILEVPAITTRHCSDPEAAHMDNRVQAFTVVSTIDVRIIIEGGTHHRTARSVIIEIVRGNP